MTVAAPLEGWRPTSSCSRPVRPPGSLGERTRDFLGDLKRRIRASAAALDGARVDGRAVRAPAGRGAGRREEARPGRAAGRDAALLSPPPDQTNGVFELVASPPARRPVRGTARARRWRACCARR